MTSLATVPPSSVGAWSVLALPLAEAVLIGLVGGLVGAVALLRKRIFFTESITHATFPGAVVGVLCGAALADAVPSWDRTTVISIGLLAGATLFCLPMAALMRGIAAIPGQSSQAAAGMVLTVSFALGYFLATWWQPLPVRTESFLAGSLVTVTRADVLAVGIVLLLAVGIIGLGGERIIADSFDARGYRSLGGRGGVIEAVVLVLISATVVVIIPAVGSVLAIAVIAAPAAGVSSWTRSTGVLLWGAPLAGVLVCVLGFGVALTWNLSAGGTIAVACGVFYGLARAGAALRSHV